ncbi:hypothetical protein V8G54_001241 [Vigna mungo]|uniref:Uncharacterized protein n=1 Tax=Vigna mungo TaxID=3915 RepID=A0AAQ3S9R4_VIGMU
MQTKGSPCSALSASPCRSSSTQISSPPSSSTSQASTSTPSGGAAAISPPRLPSADPTKYPKCSGGKHSPSFCQSTSSRGTKKPASSPARSSPAKWLRPPELPPTPETSCSETCGSSSGHRRIPSSSRRVTPDLTTNSFLCSS